MEDPESGDKEETELRRRDEQVRADVFASMLATWSELEREISLIVEQAPELFDEQLGEPSSATEVASKTPAVERKTPSKDGID